jgi:SAM-dependent methyltransferase
MVEPAPQPTGNPLDNPRLAAVINRATGQPQPVDPTLPTITPLIQPPVAPVTLPEGTEYQEEAGPVTLPEGTEYREAPKNLKEAHALKQPFNPITDFDAAGLSDAAKQKAFNPVDLFMQSPIEVQNDPAVRDKVADAFMQTWEYSEKHPLEGISVGSVGKAIAHLGKGIFDWAKNHLDVVTSAAGGDKQDATTKAAENILELQLAATQLGYQGEDLAKWVARRVFKENIVKPLSAYSPEEKDKALQDEIDRRKLTQRIVEGKTLKGAEKLPLNAEKIASMAGADPLQFLAFEGAGAGLKTAGKLVPELGEAANMVTELASKAGPKVAGTVIKGVGKTAEVAAKPAEFAAKMVESTPGEYIAAHILGPPGVIAAKIIGKAGKALPKIAKAGTNIGEQLGEGITSNTAQAVKDALEAAPHALRSVLSGAAYDAAFAAPAKSPEEREGIGLGTALGLAGGASRLALHGIGGQLVGERKGAFTPKDSQVFHDTYNTGYEHHQFTDPVSAQVGLAKLGFSPETALDYSQKRGGTVTTPEGKNITFAIGADATPHEPVHAWKKSLPAEEQARLDKETRARYSDDEFQQVKDKYASQLDPKGFDGKNADEILKNASPGESADAYAINEIQAENLMTALKAGPGKGLLNKAAKVTAKVLSAVGVEPLATRTSQSEALQFPLKHQEVEGLKTALEASKPPGGAEVAKTKAEARNVEGLADQFPDKAASIATLGEAQPRGSGVKLTYAAAPGETPADIQSASPLSGRGARAASVEAARELPTWARNPWWKTFFPDRTFKTKSGKLQTGGWAPEIFQANAYRFAKEAAPHDAMRAVSPYEIDKATGFFTPDAWKSLTADLQTAVKNWRDGRTASGTPVVVPDALHQQSGGQIYQPQVGPGGGALDTAKADFISHLMGHQLPETPRLAKTFPLNVAGQDVSAATIPGRVGGPSRGEFGTYGQSPEEMVKQRERAEEHGVTGRQLLEVNPFRLKMEAAAKAAGVKAPKPLSVYQKLNHERILRIEHAPGEPEFRGNTLTQAAGFEPSKYKDVRWLQDRKNEIDDEITMRLNENRKALDAGTITRKQVLGTLQDQRNILERQIEGHPDVREFEPMRHLPGVKFEPNPQVEQVAKDYMESKGLPYAPHRDYLPVNESKAKQIADFYESAKHDPENPEVKAAYSAFTNEIKDQWQHLTNSGVHVEPWDKEGQPYRNSADMMKDVRDNHHLYFFPVDRGFGPSGSERAAGHPMLADSGITVNGKPLVMSDLNRAVHDYFGHAQQGFEFGPKGEYNAFLAHAKMFSPEAIPAMAAENIGQNSWVNFGPHLRDAQGNVPKLGETGYVAPADRSFAPQKATIIPPNLLPTPARSGLEFKKFFADVAAGKFGKSDVPFAPLQDLSDVKAVEDERLKHWGNFENHIQRSIPMLHEEKTRLADGVIKTYGKGATLLDIGSSEGDFGKAISALTDGRVKTVSLDPNPQMAKDFHDISKVPGATQTEDSFLNSFEDSGRTYPAHNPEKPYDVINEAVTFQFIDPNRDAQIAEVKRMLKPDGVFTTAEKFKTKDWAANELKKDRDYKNKYFTSEALKEKEKRVGFQQSKEEEKAVGMVDNMATDTDFEKTLQKHFKHVVQYWDSGNFKGYAASDDPAKLSELVKNIGDLNSEFSTVQTPRPVAARFEPATQAGKDAEKKGFTFKLQDHGAGVMELSLETPDGLQVSSLTASQTEPKLASVDSVITKDGYKKQGLAEALYRELGAHLQTKGVKVLGGVTVGDAPRNIRERVFGPPIRDTRLNSPGMDARRTYSAVRPETQFEPSKREEAGPWQSLQLHNVGVNGQVEGTGRKPGFTIYEFSSHAAGQGNGKQALTSLKKQFGKINVIDPGQPGTPSRSFWDHMLKSGHVDSLLDADGTQIAGAKPQFEPASAAGAEGKDAAKAEKAWQEKGFKSPYFKKWFGKSKVVDSEGEPKVVYHGTTHEFDQFTMDRANVENAFGKGFYFTDDSYDASDNYAGLGPDLKMRVDRRAEEIRDDYDTAEPPSKEEAQRKAMEELAGNADRTIEAYLKMENPAVIKKNGGTQFEYHFDEDTATESGTAMDLHEAIMKVAPKFGVDGQELWGKVFENGEATAHDVHNTIRKGEFYADDPDSGDSANGEMEKEIYRHMGHDGIILHNAEEEYPGMHLGTETTHYIAFDPTQVKAAKNRGTFSKTDPRYNFEPAKSLKTKEIASDIWEKAKAGGGFTYNPYTRQFVTTGYSASIYPDHSLIIDPKDLTQATLEKFIEDRKHLLTRAENSVGGWLNPENGKLYLDVSFTTPSRPLAEFAGREYNQISIGDLSRYAAGDAENGSIPTGGTGEPIEDMHPAHQRVEELLKDFDWEQPDIFGERPQQELMPGIGTRAPLSSKDIGSMTKAELQRHFPEALLPKRRKDLINYDIENAPRWKGKEREDATNVAADELEKFARTRLHTQEFQDGLKWYSEFVPLLKRAYGKSAEMMAQLLAATSPRNSPTPNFALANDAIEGYKAGRFDKQIKKYLDGAKMLEAGTWKSWYEKQRKAGKLVKPRDNPSDAAFMAEWIDAHALEPRQSNGKLYGMHSVPVLQVMAGKWLTENTGPKTLQFVKNLLGVHHGATIDVWAARTMRRLGHEGISKQWRITPGNETGVSDTDFQFSQEAFEKAGRRLGVKPDALQGALWFAEKKLWAERGWGRLDFGDFRKEIAKREMLNQGIQTRLAESSKPTKAAAQTSLLDLVSPRNER